MTHDQPTADPVPPQTARKRDASPTDAGDTTTARRQLLALLLDRIERGALLPTEVPLLRACVTAEQGEASSNVIIRAKIAEAELEALRGGVREWGADPTNLQNMYAQLAMRTRQWDGTKAELAAAQATITRVATALNSLGPLARFHIASALGDTETADAARAEATGLRPTSDDEAVREPETVFCSPLVTANCPGHVGPPYCERAPSSPTTATPLDWTPTDDLVTADAPSEPTPETPRV